MRTRDLRSSTRIAIGCTALALGACCNLEYSDEPHVLAEGLLYEITGTNCLTLEREVLGWGVCESRDGPGPLNQVHYWVLSAKAHRPPAGIYEIEAIDDHSGLPQLMAQVPRDFGRYSFIISHCYERTGPDEGFPIDGRSESIESLDLVGALWQTLQSDVGSIGIWNPTPLPVEEQSAAMVRPDADSRGSWGAALAAYKAALGIDSSLTPQIPDAWPDASLLSSSYPELWLIQPTEVADDDRPRLCRYDPGRKTAWIGECPGFPTDPDFGQPHENHLRVLVENVEHIMERK